MTPPSPTLEDPQTVELARRMCAAFLSVQFGTGLEYTLRQYVRGTEPGTFWLEIARAILKQAPASSWPLR